MRIRAKKRKQKKRFWILVIILLVVIGIGGMYLKTIFFPPEFTANTAVDSSLVKDMDEKALQKFLQDKADGAYVRLTIDPIMTFENDDQLGYVNIQNSPKNKYNLRIQSYLKDSRTKIYDSGIIRPKQFVEKGKLLSALDKGEYPVTNIVEYLDEENEKLGESTVKGKLIIRN